MDRLREYKIAFRGLGEGIHPFEFILDRQFFDCFETTKGTNGTINANVVFVKTALLMEVKIKLSGHVKAICDRCLEEMELEITGELQLYVKQSEREEGNDDDFIVLAPDDDFLDLSSYLYETYLLNYPMRIVHPDGGCDINMKNVLDNYIIDEDDKPTDPRWDELRKLINN